MGHSKCVLWFSVGSRVLFTLNIGLYSIPLGSPSSADLVLNSGILLSWDPTALSTTQTHPAALWVVSKNELYSDQLEVLRPPPPSDQDQCGTGKARVNCRVRGFTETSSYIYCDLSNSLSATPSYPTHFPFHILIFMLLMSGLLPLLSPNVRETMWHIVFKNKLISFSIAIFSSIFPPMT